MLNCIVCDLIHVVNINFVSIKSIESNQLYSYKCLFHLIQLCVIIILCCFSLSGTPSAVCWTVCVVWWFNVLSLNMLYYRDSFEH